MNTTLQVRKSALGETRVVREEDAPLSPGCVRVRVDTFSLTANNITYAAFGDAMNYWQFFPTGDADWGVVPVWGFGQVVQSLHPGVAVGERLWGYWPMSSSAVLRPDRLDEHGFMDGVQHRKELHGVYNHYVRTSLDPFYTRETEDVQAILRPLYATSWLIDDFLTDNSFFGAKAALLSSASSKTAYATACQLKQRGGVEVIGFTSARNVAFCESLGCYHRVLTYEQVGELPAALACVFIDFAGNAGFRREVHTRFGNLVYSCSVGGTHVDQLGGAKDLPGPRATLFFAPAQRKKRAEEWGADALNSRLLQGWTGFREQVCAGPRPWLAVRHHRGADAVVAAYLAMVRGETDPREGHMLSLAG